MGEQPIFTCKAHVFHIDPKTKRSWIPASSSAINVSFFYDSTRTLYRIISVEGTKAVINSTITPNMTFTKTSQKFGQWSDVRANTVYGLGFPSEAELNKFIEKFQEVKEATKNISSGTGAPLTSKTPPATNGSSGTPTPAVPSNMGNSTSTSANASPVSSRSAIATAIGNAAPVAFSSDVAKKDTNNIDPDYSSVDGGNNNTSSVGGAVSPALLKSALVTHQRSQSLSGLQQQQQQQQQTSTESPKHQKMDKTSPGSGSNVGLGGLGGMGGIGSSATLPHPSSSGSHMPMGSVEAQLKYENDRLKLALAQSSANAKKWEVELATLKNNNARLTSALQESTANVEEWKRQLQAYKEENTRVKSKLVELEAGRLPADGTGNGSTELKRETATLRLKVESLESEIRTKDEEIRRLTQELRDFLLVNEKVKDLEEENARLEACSQSVRSQMSDTSLAHDTQRKILEALNNQLMDKIQELTHIHREIQTALDT